jgi:hypothetical protein
MNYLGVWEAGKGREDCGPEILKEEMDKLAKAEIAKGFSSGVGMINWFLKVVHIYYTTIGLKNDE